MRHLLLVATAPLLVLAACNEEAPAPQPSPSTSAAASPAAGVARPPAGQARSVEESNDRYEFAYAYPAAADAIPALKAKLDADLAEQRAELVAEAKEGADDAKEGGFPYHPHSRMMDWKVVTDLPGWLSLSTIVSTFEGGAHPNYVYDALLWDKSAGRQRAALDLFTSKQALSTAIGQAFCDAIDRQRQKKRGQPIDRASGDLFTNCLDPVDYTVILGSAGRRGLDRIGFLVPPYEAGPYAEGGYEVTLPVSAKVMALVKPEFRASFAAAR
ncbi:MAG: DUF3298 and DUF4163 domain-containing protein [Novosphingobium sp.]